MMSFILSHPWARSSRCTLFGECWLFCVKEGRVTSSHTALSLSLSTGKAWYLSLSLAGAGFCWAAAGSELLKPLEPTQWIFSTARSERQSLCGEDIQPLGQRPLYAPGKSPEDSNAGTVIRRIKVILPFKIPWLYFVWLLERQHQWGGRGRLVRRMKGFTPFFFNMIVIALLIATVSATKINVPRLRLSYKGNLSILSEMLSWLFLRAPVRRWH